MRLSEAEARERVAKGIVLLDEKFPGWAPQIDVGRLSMAKSCRCVLGQLRGNFRSAARALWPEDQRIPQTIAHGFWLQTPMVDGCTYWTPELRADYRTLQDAWIDAIADRVVEQQPEPVLVAKE